MSGTKHLHVLWEINQIGIAERVDSAICFSELVGMKTGTKKFPASYMRKGMSLLLIRYGSCTTTTISKRTRRRAMT